MWIVRLALRRPYTFVVGALVLLLLTPYVLLRTPTDIFPAINIPVISIVWQYAGLDAQEVRRRGVDLGSCLFGSRFFGLETGTFGLDLFDERGFDAVTIEEIARTIIKLVGSKSQIVYRPLLYIIGGRYTI